MIGHERELTESGTLEHARAMAPGELTFRLPYEYEGQELAMFLRLLRPHSVTRSPRIVLYVHGATFRSALSIAHRFDGRSWRDALAEAGYHVWGLDFLGYGESSRYPGMNGSAEGHEPLDQADEGARQIEAAVGFMRQYHRGHSGACEPPGAGVLG